jgi:hypothetical protein
MKNLTYITLCLALMFSGCSKDDDDETTNTTPNPTPSGITINSAWQYSIKTDGTTHTAVEGTNNFQGSFSWSASLTVPPDSSSTSFGSGLSDNNSSNLSFGIDMANVYFLGNECDTNTFKAAIHTGSYTFHGTGINGVEIGWVDANGEIWSTSDGSGDQTGSAYTVTDVQRVGLVLGQLILKFKATFNCKLYNMNTGQSMTLTDGVYVGRVANYN